MKSFNAVVLSVFIFIIQYTDSVEIKCNHQANVWVPFGTLDECLAYNVESTEPDGVLEEVKSYENIDDYKSLYIYQSPLCYYLPKGIMEKFKNLEVLVIAHTGLKSITKDDLKPFINIRGLYIDHNAITSIPEDLFMYNNVLEELSLQENQIKHVHQGSFDSLLNLKSFNFINECYSKNASGRKWVEDLFFEIVENCKNDESDYKVIDTTRAQGLGPFGLGIPMFRGK